MSNDIGTLRNDTERKFQEGTTNVGGVSDSLNDRIDAHVVATRKLTDRISQEANGRAGQTGTDVITYRYNMYTAQMDPTLTGSELMVHRIHMTDEGATTLAAGSKTDGGVVIGHKTAAYP